LLVLFLAGSGGWLLYRARAAAQSAMKVERRSRPRATAARARPGTLRGVPRARVHGADSRGGAEVVEGVGGAAGGRRVCVCEWDVFESMRSYVLNDDEEEQVARIRGSKYGGPDIGPVRLYTLGSRTAERPAGF
jgi:hypothetical protein